MKHEIDDAGDPRYYWTQIPNIVFDIGLSSYEFLLYSYLKRVAGNGGKCFQSTRTLAKKCSVSVPTIIKAKQLLSRPRADLNGKALITVKERANPKGGQDYHEISIADIWRENALRYSEQGKDIDLEQGQQNKQQGQSRVLNKVNDIDRKKNILKKNDEEGRTAFISDLQSDPAYERLDVAIEFRKAERWCSVNRRQLTPKFFVSWLNRIEQPFRPVDEPMNGNGHDASWHARQAELARRAGRVYRPTTT